jgi:hypothetical protein
MIMPIKYKKITAKERKICVMGSVEGVKTAAIIVDPTRTYFHPFIIC